MPLTKFTATTNVGWAFSKTNAPFGNINQGPDADTFALSGLDLTLWTEAAISSYTLTAGQTTDFDFSAFTDLVGEAVSGKTKALTVLVHVGGPSTAQCTVTASIANGLNWFFGTSTLTLGENSVLLYSLPATNAGFTIDATHKLWRFQNSGTGSMTVKVIALVK